MLCGDGNHFREGAITKTREVIDERALPFQITKECIPMQKRISNPARLVQILGLMMIGLLTMSVTSRADNERLSKPFQGVKANAGTVTYSQQGDKEILTLSDDFKIPDAPAPHWQIVDSLGNTYLLERLQ